jgi:hypothetical protein
MCVSRHDVPLVFVRMQTSHAESNFTLHVKLNQNTSPNKGIMNFTTLRFP